LMIKSISFLTSTETTSRWWELPGDTTTRILKSPRWQRTPSKSKAVQMQSMWKTVCFRSHWYPSGHLFKDKEEDAQGVRSGQAPSEGNWGRGVPEEGSVKSTGKIHLHFTCSNSQGTCEIWVTKSKLSYDRRSVIWDPWPISLFYEIILLLWGALSDERSEP
jgi:hypothetical protein